MTQFARRDDNNHYTWNGIKMPSVTTIQGTALGSHLLIWYAQMAAQDCAKQWDLYHEGHLTLEGLQAAICDIETRKTAAIRYRDFRAAIGSITHHAMYDRAIGRERDADYVGYLRQTAIALGLADEEDREGSGEPYSLTLARAAGPFVESMHRTFDVLKPDWHATAQEAVVVSTTNRYAGSLDLAAHFAKANWTKLAPWKWGDWRKVSLAGDGKTSTSMDAFKFPQQIEAYRRADFIGLVQDGSEHAIPETQGVVVFHFRPLDVPGVHAWSDTDDADHAYLDDLFEDFLGMRFKYGLLHEMPNPNHKRRAPKTPKKDPKVCPFAESEEQ
jgi:hypothetical protein